MNSKAKTDLVLFSFIAFIVVMLFAMIGCGAPKKQIQSFAGFKVGDEVVYRLPKEERSKMILTKMYENGQAEVCFKIGAYESTELAMLKVIDPEAPPVTEKISDHEYMIDGGIFYTWDYFLNRVGADGYVTVNGMKYIPEPPVKQDVPAAPIAEVSMTSQQPVERKPVEPGVFVQGDIVQRKGNPDVKYIFGWEAQMCDKDDVTQWPQRGAFCTPLNDDVQPDRAMLFLYEIEHAKPPIADAFAVLQGLK